MRKTLVATAVAGCLAVAGCGGDDAGDEQPPAAQAKPAAAADAPAGGAYKPVSDVAQHAAIGKDVAAIRELIEPAKEGGDADFAEAAAIWSDGRNSTKGDGSARTLAGFVEESPVAQRVEDALSGNGEAGDLDPAQRVQWIDKGMTVALKIKVLGELDAAKEKIAAGETSPDEGAPHNVDEAWAFFVADGEGVESTAKKRAADFGLPEDELSGAVVAALGEAQKAAVDGDEAAFDAARERARGALNRIFALAIKKYAVEGQDDAVARAEGIAISWGLGDELSGDAAATVEAAFAEGADDEAIAALDQLLDDRAAELAIDGSLPDYKP